MGKNEFIQECARCREAVKEHGRKQLKGFHQLKVLEYTFEYDSVLKHDQDCYKALEETENAWEQAVIENRSKSK